LADLAASRIPLMAVPAMAFLTQPTGWEKVINTLSVYRASREVACEFPLRLVYDHLRKLFGIAFENED
jgi:hypothetical protein